MNRVIGIILGLSFIAASGISAPKKSYQELVNSWPTQLDQWLEQSQGVVWEQSPSKAEQDAKKTKERVLATAGKMPSWYEAKMSPQLVQAREEFLQKATTPDQLDALLAKWDREYGNYPDDLKFFVAQAIPFRTFRGFIWKMVPAVDDHKIVHSMLITQVRGWANNLRIFFPTDQWNAGIQYIVQPYVEVVKNQEQVARRFNNEADVQGYIGSVIFPALMLAEKRVRDLHSFVDRDVVWDNQLIFGRASFVDTVDRFRLVGEPERLSVIAALNGALSQLAFFNAYSQERLFDLNAKVGNQFGLDSKIFFAANGVPAEKVAQVISDKRFKNWGTLFETQGPKWMKLSFNYLNYSVGFTQAAIDLMGKRPVSEEFLINTAMVNPLQRPLKYSISDMLAMIHGPAKIRSAITGKTVEVNLPLFYSEPPQDLKKFIATDFNKEAPSRLDPAGSETVTIELTGPSGKRFKESYRNYAWGQSYVWDYSQFQKYLPEVKSRESLLNAAQILTQSWGGFTAAPPLLPIIQ